MSLRFLFVIAALAGGPAFAQEGPVPGDEAVQVDLFPDHPEAVREAARAWVSAWERTPRLVSLQVEVATNDLVGDLEARLKKLGEKTFSNREWKTYWENQAATVVPLIAALREAGGPAATIGGLERWKALADAKVANQDAFFEAIELERDALEDRLEAALESTSEAVEDEPLDIEDPNPYEQRRMRLDELERSIAAQKARRDLVASEVTYIERLLESEEILARALARDLELAQTELEIARDLADPDDAWGRLWMDIAAQTEEKVSAIADELEFGRARHRSREVELGLAKSQIAFRDTRIAELQAAYDAEASWTSFLAATWQTVLEWLRGELWRIVLGLSAVYVGVRVALHMVRRVVQVLLERTDDDPDVDDDGDQRRKTLAEVFASVARITIFVIGGLLALEQIGISTGPLLGSVAILGLAISFGAQNLVRDVVNGFFILLENQYAVGDVVTVDGVTGTVERITIRSTWVRSYNGDLHAIPNGSISKSTNLTRGWSRTIVDIGIGYGADIDAAEQILNEVGQEMFSDPDWRPHLEEAPTFVGVTALGDSAVSVRMHVKVHAGQQWAVQRELFRRAKVAFDAKGIEIPFPQIVVHQAG